MQKINDRVQNTYLSSFVEMLNVVEAFNPRLSTLIQEKYEQLKDMLFFIVDYPFGKKIIYKRDVYLPVINDKSISFNDPSLPDIIRDSLSYIPGTNNPVGMILNKQAEFYTSRDERIISYPVIKTGQIFGFAHIIDAVMNKNSKTNRKAYVSTWNLDAGARTAFILPKVSENGSHSSLLKAYGIKVEKPNTYIEQNKVFSALNSSIDNPWTQSVLYFPKQFLEKLKHDLEYAEIYQEMAHIHRLGYNIWHTNYAKWESDINYVFQKTKSNSLSAYAVNIAKHIYLITADGVPGLAPTIDESMLPKDLIETAYNNEDGYGLKEYWPITLQPRQFDGKETIYYSLSLPTLINYNPETFKNKTSIALLFEVADIMCRCQKYILNEFEDKESLLYENAVKAQFSFYHDDPNPEKYGKMIKNSAIIPEEDPRFYKKGWLFPAHSQLLRGCIKIEPVS